MIHITSVLYIMIKKIKQLLKGSKSPIWELPIESKEKVDDKLADFIINHAEKALAYSLDVADKTTNRAYAVIVLMIPLTSTTIGLLIKEAGLNIKLRNPHKVTFFEIITVLCLASLVLLLTIVLPRLTMGNGRSPKDLAHDNMLQNENSPERKLLLFKLNEIKNLQYKIGFNSRLNAKRVFRFKVALLIICIGFIGGAIMYAMLG
jgi:hypothetical protein